MKLPHLLVPAFLCLVSASYAQEPTSKLAEKLAPLQSRLGTWTGKLTVADPDAPEGTAWLRDESRMKGQWVVRDYVGTIGPGKHEILSVMGWDPVSKQIKSWSFHAGGGYVEQALKSHDEDTQVWTDLYGAAPKPVIVGSTMEIDFQTGTATFNNADGSTPRLGYSDIKRTDAPKPDVSKHIYGEKKIVDKEKLEPHLYARGEASRKMEFGPQAMEAQSKSNKQLVLNDSAVIQPFDVIVGENVMVEALPITFWDPVKKAIRRIIFDSRGFRTEADLVEASDDRIVWNWKQFQPSGDTNSGTITEEPKKGISTARDKDGLLEFRITEGKGKTVVAENAEKPSNLKPITSVEQLAEVMGVPTTTKSRTELMPNTPLLHDIPGFGKQGMPADLTVVTRMGPARKFVIDDATLSREGKTVDAFHGVWGPDGVGGFRLTIFRADGITYGGLVFTNGKEIVVKLRGEQKPTTEKDIAQWGKNLVRWTAEVVFSTTDDGQPTVETRNIVVNDTIKLPNIQRQVGRVIEEE